jgi:hypothetical protein
LSASAGALKKIADPWRKAIRVLIHDGPRDFERRRLREESSEGPILSARRVRRE